MLLTLVSALVAIAGLVPPAWPEMLANDGRASPPAYEAGPRAVTNWRPEASHALHPAPLAWLARAAQEDPAFVSRCVRLNNYWCIKRAGWAGEIGADAEGHTAFADPDAGADAAVTLLRRYYVTYGRRSALAIVKHWAPAECAGGPPGPGGSASQTGGSPLAVHGIGRTLRARFLARHGRGGQALRRPGGPATRVAGRGNPRIQPFSALAQRAGRPARPLRPAGIRPIGPAPTSVLADVAPMRPLMAPLVPPLPAAFLPPPPLCAADTARIANYAMRIAASVGRGPDDDLGLFSPDGRPQAALAPALLAMSSVELGTFRARAELVAAAIARILPSAQAAIEPPTAEGPTCTVPCGMGTGTPPSSR